VGTVTSNGGQNWVITVFVPSGVPIGTPARAQFGTTIGTEFIQCTNVISGQTFITCNGNTVGIALQNSAIVETFTVLASPTPGGAGISNVPPTFTVTSNVQGPGSNGNPPFLPFGLPCITPVPGAVAVVPTNTSTATSTVTITPITLTPTPPVAGTSTPTGTITPVNTVTPTNTTTPTIFVPTPGVTAVLPAIVVPTIAPPPGVFFCTPTPTRTATPVGPTATATTTSTPVPGLQDPVEVAAGTVSGNQRVFAALRAAQQVAFIDAGNNTIISRTTLQPLGRTPGFPGVGTAPVRPQAIAFDPTGTGTIYTGNQNGTLSVIDATSGLLITTIDLSQPVTSPTAPQPPALNPPAVNAIPDPAGIVVYQPGPGVRDVWVTDRANGLVYVIDATTNAVSARIAMPPGPGTNPARPEGIAATSPDNQFAPNNIFVALPGTPGAPDNRVARINAVSKLANLAPITVASRPTDVHVSLDTQYLYVTNFASNNTSVVDLRCLAGTCPLAGTPPTVDQLIDGSQGPFRVTAIDQGAVTNACGTNANAPANRVYVANQTSGSVSIFNVVQNPAATGGFPCRGTSSTVSVGAPPGGPDRISVINRAYVPVPSANEIRVFQGDQVIATIR
jgi:YVTN family beta-propeller protein